MVNLNEFLTFVTIAEAGSFSQAAERLGISKALATKHVAELEHSLGVKLLHRNTRRIGLTAAGEMFLERCKQLLAQAEAAVQDLDEFRSSPVGHVKVSSAMAFGRIHLVPLIARFLDANPGTSVDLHLTDRFADLVTSGEDVVIRTAAEPRLLSLVAKPLAPWRWILCAAPSYLERHGTPRRPQDLTAHNCIVYSTNAEGVWRFAGTGAEGGEEPVRVRGNYKANNADGVLQGTLQGLGVAAITTMAAGDEVRAGRLVRLLPEWQLPHSTLYAAHLPNPTMQLCVRRFIQFLQDELGETPYWDEGLGFAG